MDTTAFVESCWRNVKYGGALMNSLRRLNPEYIVEALIGDGDPTSKKSIASLAIRHRAREESGEMGLLSRSGGGGG
jgi:hypothetical protein